MSLNIFTTTPSPIALANLAKAGKAFDSSLVKLATGSRINRAADDPAGLITSENLRAALAAIESESRAHERTDAVANVADGALAEVSGLLNDANAAAVAGANSAGLSQAERDGYQLEIDSARQSIERIVSTTEFIGQRLFDGGVTLSSGDASVAIPSIAAPDATQDSIAAAIAHVSTARAQIGAFQKYSLGAQSRAADAARENIAAANSVIRDTDFAAESAALARAHVLKASGLMASSVASGSPRIVLGLLR